MLLVVNVFEIFLLIPHILQDDETALECKDGECQKGCC